MSFDPESIVPYWYRKAKSSFLQEKEFRPKSKKSEEELVLNVPDISTRMYAYHIQGRKNDVYELISTKRVLRDEIPSYTNDEIIEFCRRKVGDKMETVTHVKRDYESIKIIDSEEEKVTVEVYAYYPAVEYELDGNEAYMAIFDIFTLMRYYDVFQARIDLPHDIVSLFLEEGRLFDPEIEVCLVILSQEYGRRFHHKLRTLRVSDAQNNNKFVTPTPNALGRDYMKLIREFLPFTYGKYLPRDMITKKFISYSANKIYCVSKDLLESKLVSNISPIDRGVYITDKSTLMKRLREYIQLNMPPEFMGTDIWTMKNAGICIAGGLLSALASDIAYEKKIYEKSDIDLYIYGFTHNKKILLTKLLHLLERNGYEFRQWSNIVNAVKDGYPTIQIVCAGEEHYYHIIYRFDQSAVQIAYDGADIVCTPDYLYYGMWGCDMFFPPRIDPYRIIRAIDRKYLPISDKLAMMGGRIQHRQLKYVESDNAITSTTRYTTLSERKQLTFQSMSIDEVLREITFNEFAKIGYGGRDMPTIDSRVILENTPFIVRGSIKGSYLNIFIYNPNNVKVINRDIPQTLSSMIANDIAVKKKCNEFSKRREESNIDLSTLSIEIFGTDVSDMISNIPFRKRKKDLSKLLTYARRAKIYHVFDNLSHPFRSHYAYLVYAAIISHSAVSIACNLPEPLYAKGLRYLGFARYLTQYNFVVKSLTTVLDILSAGR